MSTPLSLSLPETGTLSVVSATAPKAAPMVTEQVAVWTVLGVVAAAVATGIVEVALHLAG